MQIIHEGDSRIMKLWGRQPIKQTGYRLMKYLLDETVDGEELLCNNVTGELVLLDEDESKLIHQDIIQYSDMLDDLIEHHYLVPVEYDEYDVVIGIRKVLRLLTPKSESITNYTILPTTACNARCYYCFEKGSKIETMTEQTANDVVDFIKRKCGGNPVTIDWFGGEPTVAHNRISQICRGLTESGVEFTSTMITNGYLFDENLVNEAVDVWRMNFIRFSFDGSRENYNKIKNYVNPCNDPYEKVVSSIGHFLNRDIYVAVRMNFDIDTADDFQNLVNDLYERYGNNSKLSVFSYPVHGEHADKSGTINHGSDDWLAKMQILLDENSSKQGLFKIKNTLPQMLAFGCMANNCDCITVTPNGGLTRCASLYDDESLIGNIYEDITDIDGYNDWEITGFPGKCKDCVFIPLCLKIKKCPGFEECCQKYRNFRYIESINNSYRTFKGGICYENGEA